MPSLFDNPDATGNTQDLEMSGIPMINQEGRAAEEERSREGSSDEPSAEPISSDKEEPAA